MFDFLIYLKTTVLVWAVFKICGGDFKIVLYKLFNNFLLTEHEGRTGECWPEVVAVRTERSEIRTKTTEGQYSPVRLELARLVSSLLYGFLITFCFVFASP